MRVSVRNLACAAGATVAFAIMALLWQAGTRDASPPLAAPKPDAGVGADSRHKVSVVAVDRSESLRRAVPRGVPKAVPEKADIVFTVRDAVTTEPVAGARVWQEGDNRIELSPLPVATDERGSATLSLAGRGQRFFVDAEGYASRDVYPSVDFSDNVTVHLWPALAIDGLVVDERGVPVGAGCLVVAWPAECAPEGASELQDILESERSGAFAETDSAGRFRLNGLARGRLHEVVAGGDGAVTIKSEFIAPGVDEERALTLSLSELYGVLVAPRSQSGDKFDLDQGRLEEFGVIFAVPRGKLTPVSVSSPNAARLALAGVFVDEVQLEAPTDRLYLCARVDPEASLSARVGVRFPGYVVASTNVPLDSVRGGVRVHELRLADEANGAGKVEFRFLGGQDAPDGASRTAGAGRLTVAGEDGSVYGLSLRDLSQPVSFALPVGSYSFALSSSSCTGYRPVDIGYDDFFHVGTAGVSKVDVDVKSVGSIRIILWRENGEEYTGRMRMRVPIFRDDGVARYKGTGSFSRPPYLLCNLPVGSYQIDVTVPKGADILQAQEQCVVDVVAGESTELHLLVDG